jgi:hypothetical protein
MDAYLCQIVLEDLGCSESKERLIIKIPLHVMRTALEPTEEAYVATPIGWDYVPIRNDTIFKRRGFRCLVSGCKFQCATRGALTAHGKRHRNPYVCYCGDEFLTLIEFRKHKH